MCLASRRLKKYKKFKLWPKKLSKREREFLKTLYEITRKIKDEKTDDEKILERPIDWPTNQ